MYVWKKRRSGFGSSLRLHPNCFAAGQRQNGPDLLRKRKKLHIAAILAGLPGFLCSCICKDRLGQKIPFLFHLLSKFLRKQGCGGKEGGKSPGVQRLGDLGDLPSFLKDAHHIDLSYRPGIAVVLFFPIANGQLGGEYAVDLGIERTLLLAGFVQDLVFLHFGRGAQKEFVFGKAARMLSSSW